MKKKPAAKNEREAAEHKEEPFPHCIIPVTGEKCAKEKSSSSQRIARGWFSLPESDIVTRRTPEIADPD